MNTTWRKAWLCSAAVHGILFAILVLCLAYRTDETGERQLYVVDLTVGGRAGSGHAGGGGGGESLFPEKLTEEAVAAKTSQAESSSLPTPAVSQEPIPSAGGKTALPHGDQAHSQGIGSGSGGGVGGGSGSGIGEGEGNGRGYGEGAGDGRGSGYSGAEGTGTEAFDTQGFWEAVNAAKQYPVMAVKRNLEGVVTVRTSLDINGNCLSAEVVSSSGYDLLDRAAVAAAKAACPFPNATGQTVSITTSVSFVLE